MASRSSRASKNVCPRSPAVSPLADVSFPFNTAASAHGYGSGSGSGVPPPFHLYGEQQKQNGREGWEGKEDEDGLYLRFDMPGASRENISVRFKGDRLVMKGQGEKDFEDSGEDGPAYNYNMQLHELHLYDTKAMKVDMVNGVLKVFVPKF